MTCHVCGGDEAKDRENARLKEQLVRAFNEISRLDALLLRYQDATAKLEAYHASWEKMQKGQSNGRQDPGPSGLS